MKTIKTEKKDRISSKAKQIEISDIRNVNKVHVFRFYNDGHVHYNQRCLGYVFYKRFQRVNMKFGYAEYLKVAKQLLNNA